MRNGILAALGLLISAAHAAHADCSANASNLVPNCGFETQTEVDSWTIIQGSTGLNTTLMRSGAASLDLTPQDFGSFHRVIVFSPCFQINPGVIYGHGAYFQLITGSVDGFCVGQAELFSDTTCMSSIGNFGNPPSQPAVGAWSLATATLTSPANAEAAMLQISCSSSVAFTVVADDTFFGENLVPVELFSFTVQ